MGLQIITAAVFSLIFILAFLGSRSADSNVTVLLVWAGFTTPAKLGSHRAYVLLGAFVVGMLLTPPDVISQTLLAVPVYLLYELGIVMSRVMVPGHKEVESQQNG